MPTVHIQYFAALREARGQSHEVVETGQRTIQALYNELRERHQFPLKNSQVKAALNGSYTSMQTELSDGDNLVFIPPVAGG